MTYRFRVRAAAIILNKNNEILLVLHKDPYTGEEWWTLPGGGLEGKESAIEAVIREVKEECGINCKPGKLAYVREFIMNSDTNVHHVELYFSAEADSYDIITGIDPELEKQYIVQCCFLSRREIENTSINVYPEILRDKFWDDLESGFIGYNPYLGLQEEK
ncbi:NUDIX domain-containing protein [Lutispora thermophila]|mgnify:CR=1 FL=1|uniref:NUDIX domain-containing protein n=1 Tax=Lutispora thermophila DSM 19022 TaxID=1122184 RepID=A0A1M6FVH3_9FIRM|nr:NUDIX hydrolase [Lutispora thermophila]SHJ01693.1 NUDIX domain-containing protein [Lutispora thermophila DSM 19022]